MYPMLRNILSLILTFLFVSNLSFAQVNAVTLEGDAASFNDSATTSRHFLGTIGRTPNPHYSPLPTDWWSVINIRHRNGSADGPLWGTQIATGLTYNRNRMFLRSQVGGTWDNWVEVLTNATPRALINGAVDDGYSALQANGNVSATSYIARQETGQYGSRLYSLHNTQDLPRFALGYHQLETGNNTGSNFAIFSYDDGGNYLGAPLVIARATGNVGIGTDITNAKLTVNGGILAKKVKVSENLTVWPDYVFDKNYVLPSLEYVAQYISKHQHLPEIPSAAEVAVQGHDLGEMNKKLLKKVEELTLYLIDQQKQLEQQAKKQSAQQEEINALRVAMDKRK